MKDILLILDKEKVIPIFKKMEAIDLISIFTILETKCIKEITIPNTKVFEALTKVFENETVNFYKKQNNLITIMGGFPSSLLNYKPLDTNIDIDIFVTIPIRNVPSFQYWEDLDTWIRKNTFDTPSLDDWLQNRFNTPSKEIKYAKNIPGGVHLLYQDKKIYNYFEDIKPYPLQIIKIYIPVFKWVEEVLDLRADLLETYMRLYLIANCDHGLCACYIHSFDKKNQIINIVSHGSPDDHATKTIVNFENKYYFDFDDISYNKASRQHQKEIDKHFQRDIKYYNFSINFLDRKIKTVENLTALASFKCVPVNLITSHLTKKTPT